MARPLVLALTATLVVPAVALGQTESPPPPPTESNTVPVLFVVAPTDPADRTLTLLIDKADCGMRKQSAPATVEVSESVDDIALRVEVLLGPADQLCSREDLVRLQVELDEPLGTRAITDQATGRPALVNRVDANDLGYEYGCSFGYGRGFSVTQLLGPGHDVSDRGIPSSLEGARAMVDEGDLVVLRGPFGKHDRTVIETWRLVGDEWLSRSDRCRLMAVQQPNLDTASWRLKGRRPEAGSKTLEIWVDEWACASGNPPKGRIVPPDVRFTPSAVTIVVKTFPISRSWEANVASTGKYGFVDCQGAPPAAYKVKLHRRLGDRTLYDGGVFPPQRIKDRR